MESVNLADVLPNAEVRNGGMLEAFSMSLSMSVLDLTESDREWAVETYGSDQGICRNRLIVTRREGKGHILFMLSHGLSLRVRLEGRWHERCEEVGCASKLQFITGDPQATRIDRHWLLVNAGHRVAVPSDETLIGYVSVNGMRVFFETELTEDERRQGKEQLVFLLGNQSIRHSSLDPFQIHVSILPN